MCNTKQELAWELHSQHHPQNPVQTTDHQENAKTVKNRVGETKDGNLPR